MSTSFEQTLGVAPALATWPSNPTVPLPQTFVKTVASNATPELLASVETVFRTLQLIGQKALGAPGTSNTGNVIVQVRDSSGVFRDAYLIEPDDVVDWPIPVGGPFFDGEDFKIKVATNGDGVRVIFT